MSNKPIFYTFLTTLLWTKICHEDQMLFAYFPIICFTQDQLHFLYIDTSQQHHHTLCSPGQKKEDYYILSCFSYLLREVAKPYNQELVLINWIKMSVCPNRFRLRFHFKQGNTWTMGCKYKKVIVGTVGIDILHNSKVYLYNTHT